MRHRVFSVDDLKFLNFLPDERHDSNSAQNVLTTQTYYSKRKMLQRRSTKKHYSRMFMIFEENELNYLLWGLRQRTSQRFHCQARKDVS